MDPEDTIDSQVIVAEPIVATPVPEVVDARGWASLVVEALEVKAEMPVERDANEYNMNHEHRGKAIIFNHKNFTVDGLNVRNGTDRDRDRLAETLKTLDFEVEIYDDLTCQKVLEKVYQISLEDHSERDCLLIAVFSHGIPNRIYASDGTYKSESLWDPFTADRCRSLAGKPKIFLIQACQGEELDSGIKLEKLPASPRSFTQVDSAFGGTSYKIPHRADFFMAFSTYPGYYSWRNQNTGSWFIQSICEVFGQYGSQKDLQALITMASRYVAVKYESFVPNSHLDQMKQMPFITSTLIREVYFTPKRAGECVGTIKTMTSTSTSDPKPLFKPFFSLIKPTTQKACAVDGDDFDEEDTASYESGKVSAKNGSSSTPTARMSLVKPHDPKK